MNEKEYNDVEVSTVLRNSRDEMISLTHYDKDIEDDLIGIIGKLTITIKKISENIIIDEEG